MAISMVQLVFLSDDYGVLHSEIFVGDPEIEEMEGDEAHTEWLFSLPEFCRLLAGIPGCTSIKAEIHHYELDGDYSKRRGATAAELARIVDDNFPNNELDIQVLGNGACLDIHLQPAINLITSPAEYKYEQFIPTAYFNWDDADEQGEQSCV